MREGVGLAEGRETLETTHMDRTLTVVIVIILVLLLLGLMPVWPYSSGWGVGWYPTGGLGLILLIVIIVLLVSGPKRLP